MKLTLIERTTCCVALKFYAISKEKAARKATSDHERKRAEHQRHKALAVHHKIAAEEPEYSAETYLKAIKLRCGGYQETVGFDVEHLVDVWLGTEEPEPWALDLLAEVENEKTHT
jgi:hypothetical protein